MQGGLVTVEETEADCLELESANERLSLTASATYVHHQKAVSWPRATPSRQRVYRRFEQEAFHFRIKMRAALGETIFSGCAALSCHSLLVTTLIHTPVRHQAVVLLCATPECSYGHSSPRKYASP